MTPFLHRVPPFRAQDIQFRTRAIANWNKPFSGEEQVAFLPFSQCSKNIRKTPSVN